MTILREYEENGYKITEYTNDGETVSARIKEQILTNDDIFPSEPVEVQPKPTLEEMQAQTLLNTEVLIAMKNIGV
ncbi:hypothetical protein C7Y47_23615 [Lysinibacillus sphaericus]|uniref:Uncharacterized protein n=1 Tax=Lysinibacillus sphaericus TaxID=1421 RepID=A0A544U7P2_LYSSH|nr:hypothetical protein [Lysinibacillus sp. SDF0037]TQR27207.1 hypothetical protein C7Y47_23615 [Lysinibacillus sp. SDF0037]